MKPSSKAEARYLYERNHARVRQSWEFREPISWLKRQLSRARRRESRRVEQEGGRA